MAKKNVGSFLAFNKEWFDKNQKILIQLLNNKLTKRWFRWILRIRKDDCPLNDHILAIAPNSFLFNLRKHISIFSPEFRNAFKGYDAETEYNKQFAIYKRQKVYFVDIFDRDVRTHPKFGKRIYFAFRPIWWMLHFWDWALADRFIPQWSYGFLTLTRYPDADPETSTVDGWVNQQSTNVSFATLVAAAGTNFNDTVITDAIVRYTYGTAGGDAWNRLYRSIFLFDTSALTSSATISAATMSITGTGQLNDAGGSPDINVYSSAPASNTALAGGDFDSLGSTAFSTTIAYASWNTAGYNDFAFNASGIAAISKTGVTKLGCREVTHDVGNSAPPGSGTSTTSYLAGDYSSGSGASPDPKLVITYTTGSPSSSVSPSVSPSASISPSSSVSPSSSSSVSPSVSSSVSPSLSPSSSVSSSVSPSVSPSLSPSSSVSPSSSESPSVSSSISPSVSPSSSVSLSPSPSSSVSPSVSPSSSASPSVSLSESPSPSPSSSVSSSPSSSVSPSVSASISPSSSNSPSASSSVSPSSSVSRSPSPSSSVSPSNSPSLSPSASISPSSSVSPSPSLSFTEWTNQNRNPANWTNQNSNSASLTNQNKNSTSWTNQGRSF